MKLKNEIINEIDKLSDENFNSLKKYINKYLEFYKFKNESITKDVLEEKVCDYFELIRFDKMTDETPAYLVTDSLLSLIRVKGNKKVCTTINKYIEKANNIKKIVKKGTYSMEDLKDFSRIFLTIYYPSNKKGKEFNDSDFSFILEDIDFDKTYNQLNKEKKADEKYSSIQFSIIVLTVCYFGMINTLVKE